MINNNKPEHKINKLNLAKHVLKAQKGNKKALEYIIKETSNYIYYYCLTLLRDEDEACEAVQDIYVIMLEKIKTLKNPQAFLGWLKVVTSNYCKNRLSRKPLTIAFEEVDVDIFTDDINSQIMPEKCLENEMICEIIMLAIKNLPDIYRECVLMYYYQQLSIEQISVILDVKEGTIKSRLYNARQAIKAELEKHGRENLTFDGVSPLFYITGSLLFDSEKVCFKISLNKITDFGNTVIAEEFNCNEKLLSTAVKTIPISVAKTSATMKIVAGLGITVSCIIVTGSVVVHTMKNNDTQPISVIEQNTKVNQVETTAVNQAEMLYYTNGLTDDDRRTKIVYDDLDDLNSENNKNYIYDLMSNAIDNYKTLQGTYYYTYNSEFASTCYYSSYCFTFENGTKSKELIYNSNGEMVTYDVYDGKCYQSFLFDGNADLRDIKTFEKSICEKIKNEKCEQILSKLNESFQVSEKSYWEANEMHELDFVSLIDSKKRYEKVIDGEKTNFLRMDYANLAMSNEQYFPQTLACNLLHNFSSWEIKDDCGILKYIPETECFVILGEVDNFNGIYSYEMLVDRNTGALIYFLGKDRDGEENTALITYEFTVNGKIDDNVFDDLTNIQEIKKGSVHEE